MKTFIRKSGVFAIVLLIANLFFVQQSFTQTLTQTFTANGTFTVPYGVTVVTVEAWGGGGAGGGVNGGNNSTRAGGGGSGGTYTKSTSVNVTPGASISVTVGAGGTGLSQADGNPGGTSIFASASPISAVGGGGGKLGTGNPTNGAGGGTSIGVTFNGGAGASASGGNSGGGGGGAGSVGSGGNASGTTAGTAGSGGGGAGAAGINGEANGNDATALSGGGGGAKDVGSFFSSSDRTGGDGFRGQVIVTYICPTYSVTSTAAATPICISTGTSLITLNSTAAGLPAGAYTVSYNRSSPAGTGTASMTVTTAGTGTFTATGLSTAGSSTITVTNIASGSGCTSTISSGNAATITVNPLPTITLGTIPSICVGASSFTIPFTVGVGSPNQYSVSGTGITSVTNGSLAGGTITVGLSSPASAGAIPFVLTVRNSSPTCTSNPINGSVTATQPTVNLGASSICVGSTTTATPVSGGTWVSNNPSIATITDAGVITAGSTAGTATFTFTLSGPNGCSNTTSPLIIDGSCQVITLTEPPVLSATVSPADATCFGGLGSINITNPAGGYGNFEYTIDGGANWQASGDFPDLAISTYNVQIRDKDFTNCVVVLNAALQINQPDQLAVGSVVKNDATCNGSATGSITISGIAGGTGNTYTVSWSGPGGTQTGTALTNLVAGTYMYSVSDGTACTPVTGSVVVDEFAAFSAGAINTTGEAICYNTSPSDQIGSATDASGGDGNITYEWQSSTDPAFTTGVTTINSNTSTYTPTGPLTTTTYYRRLANDGTCNTTFTASSDTWEVTVNPTPTVTAPAPVQFYCSNIPTTGIALTGAPSGVVFDITGGALVGLPDQTGVTSIPVFNTTTGPVFATITITPRANGCIGSPVTYNVIVFPVPTVTKVTGPSPLCVGVTQSYTAVFGGGSGAWSSSNVAVAKVDPTSGNVTAVSAGTADIIFTINGSCGTPSASQQVIVYGAPAIAAQPASQIVTYGDASANFSVVAEAVDVSHPAPAYQWQVNTGSGFNDISGETSSTLTIANPTLAMSGYMYHANLTNSCFSTTSNDAGLTVNQLNVTVTADAGQTKVYGAADPASYNYTSLPAVGSSLANGEVISFTGALDRTNGEAVGSYAIGKNDLANSNYNIVYNSNDFAITPLNVTVTADAGQTKVYGEADPAVYSYTASPAVGSTLANGDLISFTGALNRANGEAVGTYAIGQNVLANSNYNIIYNADDFVISPLTVTVTADAGQTKVYGTADPVLTYTVSPALISGDSFTGALDRNPGESAGTYPITLGVLNLNSNYTLIFIGDDFTITNIPITASATAGVIPCVGGTSILTVTASGGDGSLEYSIDGGITFQPGNTFTVNAAGSPYIVTVKDEDGFSENTNSVTVTEVPSPAISLNSGAESDGQIICIGNPVIDITYSIGGNTTGATVTALPSGLTGSFNSGVFTITGTPAAPGSYPYTVTTTGPCENVSLSGNILVNDNATISLTTTAGTDGQTVCISTPIDNITYAIGGGATDATVAGLPNGITGVYNAGIFTISGTPTVSGVFNYIVATAGPCDIPIATGTITVNGNSSIELSSSIETTAQTVCINNAITNIVYGIDDGATGGVVSGLPNGITGNYNAGVFTITGTPLESGTFNYTVTTEGPCTNLSLGGTITINANSTITLSTAGTDGQTVCINNAINEINYIVDGGATGASITAGALPDGVTGSFGGGVFAITGTPSESGNFTYTVTTTGPCVNVSLTGAIAVDANSTINLSSAIETEGQTVCINNAITAITYTTSGGATSASITAGTLPAGVTGTFSAGEFTISGTPTESGTFPYTVTTEGPCTNVSLSGIITVNPDATLSLSSGPGIQTVCIDNSIITSDYTAGGSATNISITAGSLPVGVTGSFSGGVFTIQGTPTEAGIFNYTLTTAGPCENPSLSGTITVHPSPVVNLISDVSYCNNSTGTAISFSTSTPGTATYNWTSTADVGFGTFGTGNIPVFTVVNNSNSVVIATVSVTATINGCPGTPATFNVTVNPSPTMLPVSNLNYCNNGSGSGINFSTPVTGGTVTYNWTSSVNVGFGLNGNGNIGSFTAVNNSFNPLVATVTVTPSLGGCAGTPVTFTVTVNPNANAGTISGPSTICTTTLLSTNGSAGGQWTSSTPSVATVDPLTGLVTAGTTIGSATIFYTVNNICGASTSSFTISVNPTAVAGTISGPAAVCTGSSILLTTNGNSGGTWFSGSTSIATVSSAGLVTGVSAGSATIFYYVVNSCGTSISTPYIVNVSAGANPGTIVGNSSICSGTASLLFTTGSNGGTWASANPAVAIVDGTSGFVIAQNAGTTTITYTVSSNSCSSGSQVAYFTLTVNPAGNAGTITGNSNICAGTSTLLSTNGSSGGTWLSGNTLVATVNPTTGLVTGVAPGAVLITYHVSNSCGTANVTFPVIVSAGAVAGSISGSSSVCSGSAISLTSSGTPGGFWTSSNPAAAQVDGNGIVLGTGAGNTTITYTVTSLCSSSSASKSISVNVLPNAGSVSGVSTLCAGLSTPFTSNGNNGGTWSSSNPAAATVNSASGVVTAIAGGNTTITYTVNGVCGTVSSSAPITVTPVLYAGAISGGSSLCANGQTINLSASGNTGGIWTSSSTGVATVDGSGVVTSINSGNTTITYTLSNSCGASTATQLVTVNALANAGSVTGAATLCSGLSTTFTTTGTGGTWSSSNSTVATVHATTGVVTGVGAGNATITYNVATGCGNASASLPVTVNSLADAGTISGPGAVCVGTSINLNSGITGGTWNSTSGNATVNSSGKVVGVTAGTATITYTVTTTCGLNVASYTIIVNAAPNAGMIPGTVSSVCVGSSVLLTQVGGMTGGVWKSINPARASVDPVTGEVTGVSGGSTLIVYSVTNTCGTSTANLPITVNSLPNAGAISGLTSVCAGTSINLSASGDANGTWTSTAPGVASVNQNTGAVTGVAQGTTTIIYTVGSSAVCGTSSATYTVSVNPIANAGTISGTTSVCAGLSTPLTSNGAVGGTWTSSNPGVASVNAVSGLVIGVGSGNATINYTVTNVCGSTTASVPVTVNPVANAGTISGATSVCMGSTINLSSNVSGGTWSSSTHSVATITPNTGIVTGAGVGNTTITYSVTTTCGTATTSYTITVNPLPNAGTLSGTTYLCTGSTAILSSNMSGGIWSSSNISTATVNATTGVVTGFAPGTSTITYTVSSVCGAAMQSVIVTVGSLPNAGTVTGVSTLCAGSTAIFTSNGTGGGSWSSNNLSAATVDAITGVVTGVSAGSATISYTVSSTCGSSVSGANITVSAVADAGTISGSSVICAGSATTLTSNGAGGGTWSSNNNLVATVNSSTGVLTGVGAGSVTITYTVINTCGIASATESITINPLPNSGIVSGAANFCAGITTAFTSTGNGGGNWSSSNTSVAIVDAVTGAVTGVTAGSVTISYTVSSLTCGSSVSTANLTINPSPDPGTISGSQDVCAGSTTAFTSDGSINGSWISDNTSVATVNANGMVTGVAAGTTTISYMVTNGCGTLGATKILVVNPLANAGTVNGAATVCASGATTAFTSNGLGGGTWSSDNISAATVNAVSGLATGVSPGSANIIYTVTTPCGTATAQTPVTVVILPDAGSISGSSTVCAGSSVSFSSDGLIGGTWTSGTLSVATVNATTGEVTGVSAGNATITYTFANGCGSSSATKVITVNALPAAGTVTGATTVCIGAQATYTSNGLNGGSWSSSNPAAASVDAVTGVVNGIAAGSATITYTSNTPCGTTTASSGIVVVPTPDAGTVSGTNTVCVDANTNYTSSGMSGGVWSSVTPSVATVDATTGVVTGVSAGNATIRYTFTNSCGSSSASKMIVVNPLPNAGIVSGAAAVCAGSQATFTSSGLSGGVWTTSDANLALVNPATGVVIGVASGSALITYTSTTACGTLNASANINVNPVLNAGTVSGSSILCTGSTTSYTSNGSAGGTWSSLTPTVASVNATNGVVTGMSTGNATITYTVTSGCGTFSSSKMIAVSLAANPGSISGPSSVCTGSSVNLTRSGGASGGTWSSSNTSVAAVNSSGKVTGIGSGNAVISYSVSSSCGMNSITKSITVNIALTLTATNINASTDPNDCSALVTLGSNITSTGASLLEFRIGILWFSFPISSTHRFYRGTTPVTVRATNSCGSITRLFLVTITDNQPPTITCKPNTTKSANGNSGRYAVRGNEFNAMASDGCGVSSLIYSLSGATVAGFKSSNTSLNNVKLNTGTTTITWKATDVNGNVSTCNTVVIVTNGSHHRDAVGGSSSLVNSKLVTSSLEVTVAPNPTSYYFTLGFQSSSNEKMGITVTDLAGKIIEQKSDVPANSTLQLGSGYHNGVYIAHIIQGKEKVTLRLIKGGK